MTCPDSLYEDFASVADVHIKEIKSAITARNIEKLGVCYEAENRVFRKVCLNTIPPLDYWMQATHDIINRVSHLRREGIPAYAGTDAGPNVHILTTAKHVDRVLVSLEGSKGLQKLLHCKVGEGSHLIEG